MEHNRLRTLGSPVLVEDVCAVLRADCAHLQVLISIIGRPLLGTWLNRAAPKSAHRIIYEISDRKIQQRGVRGTGGRWAPTPSLRICSPPAKRKGAAGAP